jgi:hypothetical protein
VDKKIDRVTKEREDTVENRAISSRNVGLRLQKAGVTYDSCAHMQSAAIM